MDLNKCYSILQENGFVMRKALSIKSFFRIYGDGVLQVIKFRKERNGDFRVIDIGLFSLYGVIEESWLTCLMCIPQYEVLALNHQSAYSFVKENGRSILNIISEEEQADFLCDAGIRFLDEIKTQEMIVKGIKRLEYRHFRWNNTLLFPGFLAYGDWQRADMVLSACIEQHHLESSVNLEDIPEEDAETYIQLIELYRTWERTTIENLQEFRQVYIKKYYSYLEHIRARDEEWRKASLEENYERNMALCRKKHFVK